LLNDICEKHYSNNELGVKARSINLKDIEDHFTDEAKTTRDAYTNNGVKYGDTKTLTNISYTYTPDIYNYVSKDVAGESVNYYPEATIETYRQEIKLEAKSTDYRLVVRLNHIDNSMVYAVMFVGNDDYEVGAYWIASRFTHIHGTSTSAAVNFGIRYFDGVIYGSPLFNSSNVEGGESWRLRPIVRLNRDVQISELGGTAAMPRTLSR